MKAAIKLATAIAAVCAFTTVAFAEGDVKKGEKVFKKCKICHEVGDSAKKKVGPILNNIMGAKAAAQDGFSYSPAMKEAGEKGLTWTEEKMSEFLKKPKKFMPGTKMTFPGLKKAKDRDDVIAYIKQFTK